MSSTWTLLTEPWICSMIDFHLLHQQNKLWAAPMKRTRYIYIYIYIIHRVLCSANSVKFIEESLYCILIHVNLFCCSGNCFWTRRSCFRLQFPSWKFLWWVNTIIFLKKLLKKDFKRLTLFGFQSLTFRYKVGCDLPGKYRIALDSDAFEFGGQGRVSHIFMIITIFSSRFVITSKALMLQVIHDVDHFTSPEGIPGVPETNFNNRPNSFKISIPSRTCLVLYLSWQEEKSSHFYFYFPVTIRRTISYSNILPC